MHFKIGNEIKEVIKLCVKLLAGIESIDIEHLKNFFMNGKVQLKSVDATSISLSRTWMFSGRRLCTSSIQSHCHDLLLIEKPEGSTGFPG